MNFEIQFAAKVAGQRLEPQSFPGRLAHLCEFGLSAGYRDNRLRFAPAFDHMSPDSGHAAAGAAACAQAPSKVGVRENIKGAACWLMIKMPNGSGSVNQMPNKSF